MIGFRWARTVSTVASVALLAVNSVHSRADGPYAPRPGGIVVATPLPGTCETVVVPPTVIRARSRIPATLGTFAATPYSFSTSNGSAGLDYSPLNGFGGIEPSTRAGLIPVTYPARVVNSPGYRISNTPRWWAQGVNWSSNN